MLKGPNGEVTIEMRTLDAKYGPTGRGSIVRKVREGKRYTAEISGERRTVQDPHGECFVMVTESDLPRDMDAYGYG